MKQKRFFAFLLLICTLLGTVSCSTPDETVGESDFDSSTECLLASELSLYTVIIPKTISDAERTAINSLIKTVQKDFSVILSVKDDITEPVEKEILIGATNRSQSEEISKMLRRGESYVGLSNGKMIILGATEEDTVSAIAAFEELISKRAQEKVLFDSKTDLIHNKVSYDLSDMTVNGVSLTEYTILYTATNEKREKIFAELIQDVIIAKSGIIVPIQSTAKEAFGNVLVVGQSSSALGSNQAGLAATEDSVMLLGNTESDLFFAVQTLVRRLEQSTGDVQIAANEILSYTESDLNLLGYGLTMDRISIMSYNVQNAGQGASDAVTKYGNLATMIDFKNPDFVCMQECVAGTGAAEGIRKKLTNRDSYQTLQGTKNANAILYNADKYTVLAYEEVELGKAGDAEGSLYDRHFLWAKMKSKASGAVFVVISAHVDYTETAGNAQFSRMLAYIEQHFNDLSVLIAGDYNLPQPQPIFEELDAKGYENTHKTAQTIKNGKEVTFPQNNSIIDFIYERGLYTDYFEVMTQSINPSDHRPIFAECYLDRKN